ncbi:RHS repeat-associated core domain-containing protein [Lentzea sp. NBRC 105346]|uniref:RHS repeat-associated core domain-containing protein n=1 Tax=Lentzea sp. NBRC 105346 TaxID=3032205 RepID=UPI0025534696|nr:RHS repeat-associated core domain-containing protein [Lentzea sp. NBRC 105346]
MTVALVVSLAATMVAGTPALAAPFEHPKPQKERIVHGESLTPGKAEEKRTGTPFKGAAATWPKARVTEIDPGAVRTSRTPELPSPVKVLSTDRQGQKIKVETFDRAKSLATGVDGVVFRVSGGKAKISVDYSSFRWAYGGDWAARLRLVKLPECALSTPDRADCKGTVVPSTNNVAKGTITPAEATSADGALMALSAGTSSGSGSYTATSLSPSATWSAGSNTGGFTWNYDLRTPPGLNGPAPKLSLGYSSASVDGQMAASNNQPSWVGEGFQLGASFIERRYKPCADDMVNGATNTVKTGDQCWATENASLAMDAHAGELIKDAGNPNRWHLRSDDGTFVERRTGGGVTNGAKDNEHWVVTTTDGTQYWFGRSGQSTLTVPVAGNHSGEPCAAATFKDSFCTQAYRWNLEYVVDLHGNTMTYTYEKETNKYAKNLTDTDVVSYDRASQLKQIDYGTRVDRTETAPMQVLFGTADRCLSDCGVHDATHWSDVPWDQACDTSPCRNFAPTFWTTKRLATVTTKVGGNPVEKWTFTHSFPDPGDGTRAGLWLDRISHEGLVGQSTTVPDITFSGVQLSNRVDTYSDQYAAMKWWRLATISTETGGRINVNYSAPDCVPGSRMPNPNALQDNNLRCYPVRWTPEGHQDPILDYFHKYVVTDVTEEDLTGRAPHVLTKYDYVGDPAWHYTDDDGFIKEEYKTWSVWRGYEKVRTTKGDPGEQTLTETRFFRGMHGDKLPSGTRDVVLPAIATGSVPEAADEDAFAGMTREEIVYNGPGGAEVSATVNEPWQSPPTASRTINGFTVHARHANTSAKHTRTTLDGGRGVRTTTSTKVFDDVYGMAVRAEDRGDDAVAGDEKCVLTDYARNTSAWLVSAVSRSRRFVTDCTKAMLPRDQDVAGDDRMYFDGQAFGVAPTKGDVTTQETLKSVNNGVRAYIPQAVREFDAYGRVTKLTDPKGPTSTTFTPAAGGPVTRTAVTNALGWTITSDLQPAWNVPLSVTDSNQKRTDISYDGFGRTTAVWLDGRQTETTPASKTFTYLVRTNGPVTVTTKTINQDNGYVTSYQLFDGLLRPRQTQTSDAAGGPNAVTTDQYYDSSGRAVRTNNPYLADAAPGTNLFVPADTVPSQAAVTFDGTGRPVEQVLKKDAPPTSPGGSVVQRTTTAYGGDRTDVTPPTGGVRTSTLVDALGRTSELRQYHAGAAAGSSDPSTFDATKYTYDLQDRLRKVAAPSGHIWEYDYDVRGRQVRTLDPDRGTTTSTYDDADQLESTTDQRAVTLAYTYDALGRKTSVREGSTIGPKRAEWVYDTLSDGTTLKGVQVKSIRYSGSNAYMTENLLFDGHYQPTETVVTIPAAETGLAGSYKYVNTYYDDGTPLTTRIPAAGDLPMETLEYHYDGLARLRSVNSLYGATAATTLVTDTAYTSFGELAGYTLRNQGRGKVSVNRVYDKTTRRLDQMVTSRDTAPNVPADVRYGYDDAGNVTKIADVVSGDTQCFRADHLRRMTEAWTPSSGDCAADPTVAGLGGPAKYWQSFGYNVAGDRTSLVEHGTSAGDRTTTYTPVVGKHSLASTSTTDSTGTRTGSYTYDEVGNMRTRPVAAGTQTMTWDLDGRVATSVDSTGTTSYLYDADGNRLIRRDPSGKTLYLPGQELRYKTSGAKNATRYYSHAGQPIAVRTSTTLQWMSSDHHGTAELTIANTDQTVRQRRMTPFGEQRGDSSWLAFLDKGFVGGTLDNTGLTHLGAREYEPSTGRFVSVDPIMDLKDPQQMHGYMYSNNNPVTYSDPTGLAYCDYNVCQGDGGYNPNGPQNNRDGKCVVNCHNKHDNYTNYTLGSDAPAGWSPPTKPKSCSSSGYPASTQSCGGTGYDGSGSAYPVCKSCPSYSTPEKVHFIFDALGMLPWVGEGFDAINCFAYGIGGDSENASMSCAAAVPGLGQAVTAYKWVQHSDEIVDIFKAGGKCFNSFSGDTLVLMADGSTERIDEIKVGDKIANSQPESDKIESHEVLIVHVTEADKEYVDLTIATPDGPKTITATAHHPFYNATTHTWVDANVLVAGQELNTPGNGRVAILAARHYAATLRTYNLTIDAVHTYYVLAGNTPALVHNSNVCGGIALGLSEVDGDPMALHGFADAVGAKSYHDWPSAGDKWVSEFKGYVNDGKTPIHFNLNGIDDPMSAARTGRGLDPIFDGHATAWELSYIQDNPSAWSRVTFYRNGSPVANPFGP